MFEFLALTKSLKLLKIHYSTLGDKVTRRQTKNNDKKINEKKRNEARMLVSNKERLYEVVFFLFLLPSCLLLF